MGLRDYFRPIDTWSADKVREFLKDKKSDEYNLIDVRQPHEYEQGHLPGAKLMPVGDLPKGLKDLDPSKPTIAY